MEVLHKIEWIGLEAELLRGESFCGLDLFTPRKTLSSAVLGGGLNSIQRVLNLKVTANPEGQSIEEKTWDPPEDSLQNLANRNGWKGPLAAMMTSAEMESLRFSVKEEEWGGVFCILTAGISNARAAGDEGSYPPEIVLSSLPTGTINIMVGTNADLSDAALAEALMIITEAKTAVLTRYNVISPISGKSATGTGTDSVLMTSGNGPKADFCGKHTRLGQFIGEAVTEALSSSMEYLVKRKI